MPSTSEQTEAKLFQNLETEINQIGILGALYKPPNPFAEIAPMQTNLGNAVPLRTTFQQKTAAEEEKRNSRETLHEPTAKLMTDLINYCISANWDENDLANLRTSSREYRGGRAEPKPQPDPNNPNAVQPRTISTAQTSYPGKTEHFANFVESLRANQAKFKPEEERFKLSALDALVAAMRQANTDVSLAATETLMARTALDAVLYTNPDNLVDAGNSARIYVRSAFRGHQVYNAIKGFYFRKPKRLTGK
ncbi:hypothetical protein BH10ACI1_BH10ACI1_27100 [soil metagenome]